MKPLRKLIRYHRYQLDERRRRVKELEEAEAALDGQIVSLEDQLASERVAAANSPEVLTAYGVYSRTQLDLRAALSRRKVEAGDAVTEARDALLEAFAELKRYELTLARYERTERMERDRRDQIELDETALRTHRQGTLAGIR